MIFLGSVARPEIWYNGRRFGFAQGDATHPSCGDAGNGQMPKLAAAPFSDPPEQQCYLNDNQHIAARLVHTRFFPSGPA